MKNAGTNGEIIVDLIYLLESILLIIHFDINKIKMDLKGKVTIIVKANSPKSGIAGFDENKQAYKINIKAPPEKGKANLEVIKFFKKLTKKNVKILSGLKSREKTLLIE